MTALGASIEQLGYVRGCAKTVYGAPMHKEWLHFCAFAEGLEVLVNFSLMDDRRPAANPGDEHHRIVALLKTDHWRGGIKTIPSDRVQVKRGGIHLNYDGDRVEFADGRFDIEAQLPEQGFGVSMTLEPLTQPLLRMNTPLDEGDIHWFVVPKLKAKGTVWVEGQAIPFTDAAAYHDHNWGRFLWGHDFGWQWAFGLGEGSSEAWSVVLVRLTNRARTQDLGHGLFLWRGQSPYRTFREGELSIKSTGWHAQAPALALPPVMALLKPEQTTDVPGALVIHARSGQDELRCEFKAEELVQIHIPTEVKLEVTTINEVSGRFSVQGTVGGERLDIQGRGYFEHLTA